MMSLSSSRLLIALLFLFFVAAPLVLAEPGGSVTTNDGNSDPNPTGVTWAPTFNVPADSLVRMCSGDSICYNISATDPDVDDTLLLTLIKGPITYQPTYFPNPFATRICYRPGSSVADTFIWKLRDKQWHSVYDTVVFTIRSNSPPQISNQNFNGAFCYSILNRNLLIQASDPDGDKLTYTLLSGLGSISPTSGTLTYFPPMAGTYKFSIIVSDGCLSDTAIISDVVIVNQPPHLATHDTAIYVCKSDTVCVTVLGVDPEGGPTAFAYQAGPGQFSSTSDRTGRVCFVPTAVDSTYVLVFCLSDTCSGSGLYNRLATSVCFTDSMRVRVVVNQKPIIYCPSAQRYFTCNADTFCFTVDAVDPEAGPLAYRVLSGNAVAAGPTICLNNPLLGSFDVRLEVEDNCGLTDTCTVPVVVTKNSPPTIIAGPDKTVDYCGATPGTLLLPYHVSDPDNNVSYVVSSAGIVTSEGISVQLPGPGTFLIIDSVFDSCGAIDIDTAVVTAIKHDSVTIVCPPPIIPKNITLPATVRIPVSIIPSTASVTVSPFGSYDHLTGEVVLNIASPGLQSFGVTAAGYCNTDSCRFALDVNQKVPPSVSCQGNVDTLVCGSYPQTVCLPVTIGGTGVQVTVSPVGSFIDGKVCIPVTGPGQYSTLITVSNELGSVDCTTTLIVRGGRAPVVVLPRDSSITGCSVGSICLPISVSDLDADLDSVITSGGASYDRLNSRVCVTTPTTGSYQIIVRAVDRCGMTSSDTVNLSVTITPTPTVRLGSDTSITQCTPAPICLPVTVSGVTSSVRSNRGTYDSLAHKLCYTPAASGVDTVIITGSDNCRTVADTALVTVHLNRAPTIRFVDTTIYLCVPQNVCIPARVEDPDNNLGNVTVSRGTYNNGNVCFMPFDSGRYQITVTATDACGARTVVTAYVTIKTDQGLVLSGPGNTTRFLCRPDTLRFPIYGIPDGMPVTVSGTNARWNPTTREVYFYSDCCLTNTITVSITTPCGLTKQVTFTVTVRTNSRPLVLLPRDTAIMQCSPGKLCLPAAVSDPDNNIASVTATGGTYDGQRGIVCLTTTTPGVYNVTVTATDSCGLTLSDQIAISVSMGSRPSIRYTPIAPVNVCSLSAVCVPVAVTDVDNDLASVWVENGTYNPLTGMACFTPRTGGTSCVAIVATDRCGLKDSIPICVTMNIIGTARITCPVGDQSRGLCRSDSIVISVPVNGAYDTVLTNFGRWTNQTLRFFADSSGTYRIRLIAQGRCNNDTCTVVVPVQIAPTLKITCPGNKSEFLCVSDTLCYPFTVSPAGTNVRVEGGGAYMSSGQICVPVTAAGTKTMKLIAESACMKDSCSFAVTATFNRPPQINAGRDTSVTQCTLQQICLDPYIALDPDNNSSTITVQPNGQVIGNRICFSPVVFGVTNVVVTIRDSCGAIGVDTVKVTVAQAPAVTITCPPQNYPIAICGPDTVRIPLHVSPSTATVQVLPAGRYDKNKDSVYFYAATAGTYSIRVIATDICGTDSCRFDANVTIGSSPHVSTPPRIDTTLCLTSPTTLCWPVSISGANPTIQITPAGTFSNNTICVPVSTAGSTTYKIKVISLCGIDSATTVVNVAANEAPHLTVPTANFTFSRCPGDVDSICIDGIKASDKEKSVTIRKVCGPGNFRLITADSGKLCFLPTAFGPTQFCFEASDGCQTATGTFTVNVVQKPDCDVCVRTSIDGGVCTPVGTRQLVNLKVQTNRPIGGFDLLVSYDASAVAFQNAWIANTAIEKWEYFTYSTRNGSCGGACPSGLVRFVGLADGNNGPFHPPDSSLRPNGILVTIEFQISSDQTLGGQFVPISFSWFDCGDNSFSNTLGDSLLIDRRIFNAERILIWDETDETRYPEASRPVGLGAPDRCLIPGQKNSITRCIEFINGGICIIHPDSIDARGDINLNGLKNEVADAVLYTNYFIRGLRAFTINVAGQVAASDINADGFTLTVADLAYLIRILVGDADPIPKISPYPKPIEVVSHLDQNVLSVSTDAVGNIGVAYFVCDVDPGVMLGEPRLTDAASAMDLGYSLEDGKLRMLIYNIGPGRIEAGSHRLIEIPYSGTGHVSLSRSEIADYDGRPYVTANKVSTLPGDFILSQNYPNPFNPTTQISFSLPHEAAWRLTIFSITGGEIREFSGTSGAGTATIIWDGKAENGAQVASGVYLYRLEAERFSQTRKMILIK